LSARNVFTIKEQKRTIEINICFFTCKDFN
jgi:hypothetical protein